MRNHVAALVAVAEESVIDVHICVAGVLEPPFDEEVRLMSYERVGDVDGICVP